MPTATHARFPRRNPVQTGKFPTRTHPALKRSCWFLRIGSPTCLGLIFLLAMPSFGDSKTGPVFDNWSGFYLVDTNGSEFSRMIKSANHPFFQIHKSMDCNESIVIDDWEKNKIKSMWRIAKDTPAILHFWKADKNDIGLYGRYNWIEKRTYFLLRWPHHEFTSAINTLKKSEPHVEEAAIDISILTNIGNNEWTKYESIGLQLRGFTEAYNWLTSNCRTP